jgi:hypothetical protein
VSNKIADSLISELEAFFLKRNNWVDWTPTITQSVAVAININRAKYLVRGNKVNIFAELTVTGAGVAGNAIVIGGMAVAIQPTGLIGLGISTLGTCCVLDSGTAAYYGFLTANIASAFRLRDSNTRDDIGVNPNFALANTDVVIFRGSYEIA